MGERKSSVRVASQFTTRRKYAIEMMTFVEPVSDIPLYHRHANRLSDLVARSRPIQRVNRAAQALMPHPNQSGSPVTAIRAERA
jgi:hypothetical protein